MSWEIGIQSESGYEPVTVDIHTETAIWLDWSLSHAKTCQTHPGTLQERSCGQLWDEGKQTGNEGNGPVLHVAWGCRGQKSASMTSPASTSQSEMRQCYACLAWDCSKPTESKGRRNDASFKQITAKWNAEVETDLSDILELLYSSEDDGQGSAEVVQVPDKGSQPKCAQVDVQGVQGVLS